MKLGFVIDNRRCIGCHACSVACKSENEVPLGVDRTWVKTTETGRYPDTRRQFQVTRCNHCDNAPCVRICPVTAMYQRGDGIVDFDSDVCIGCKACLQACPYDAIHIDPDSGTAAKCHFCAHRVDLELEPACVVVCPEHAILAGDLEDPGSEVSQAVARNDVTVRRPEQGTAPKLFYIQGHEASLHPTALPRSPKSFMWAETRPVTQGEDASCPSDLATNLAQESDPAGRISSNGAPQGLPSGGPLQLGGRVAGQMAQLAFNAQHQVPWHWPVPTYLVTKGVSAGVFLVLALALGLGGVPFDSTAFLAAGAVSLFFGLVTVILLCADLERPERFLLILKRPQWKSWLVRGAFILIGFAGITGLWWALEGAAVMGLLSVPPWFRFVATWLSFIGAIGAAVYTAFLFAQAEGRDLWQSSLLPFHLLVQAAFLGAGAMLVLGCFGLVPLPLGAFATRVFVGSLAVDLFLMLAGEFAIPHASDVAARAARDITHGRYWRHFWLGSVGLGHIVALVSLALPSAGGVGGAVGAICAAVGLYFYEYAFVMAPQEISNS